MIGHPCRVGRHKTRQLIHDIGTTHPKSALDPCRASPYAYSHAQPQGSTEFVSCNLSATTHSDTPDRPYSA